MWGFVGFIEEFGGFRRAFNVLLFGYVRGARLGVLGLKLGCSRRCIEDGRVGMGWQLVDSIAFALYQIGFCNNRDLYGWRYGGVNWISLSRWSHDVD